MKGRIRGGIGVACLAATGCMGRLETGPPIADPGAVAARAMERRPGQGSAFLRFGWKYGDRRGNVGGEGVARYNPPDSLRLDLFTSGDAAMAIAMIDGTLRRTGDIEDIEVPPVPYLYAMAGLFRPGALELRRGVTGSAGDVLVYGRAGVPADWRRVVVIRDGRLRRVEDRSGGKVERRIELSWGRGSDWPARAEYRDFRTRSRARWRLKEVRASVDHYAPEIYELPSTP